MTYAGVGGFQISIITNLKPNLSQKSWRILDPPNLNVILFKEIPKLLLLKYASMFEIICKTMPSNICIH